MRTHSDREYLPLLTMTAVFVLAGSVGCTTSGGKTKAAAEGSPGCGTSDHATVTVFIVDPAIACKNTLHQLYEAKHQWALENRKTQTETPTDADLFGPTRYMAARPTCPSGDVHTGSSARKCTLFDSEPHLLK